MVGHNSQLHEAIDNKIAHNLLQLCRRKQQQRRPFKSTAGID
jgi:hypothetical protein